MPLTNIFEIPVEHQSSAALQKLNLTIGHQSTTPTQQEIIENRQKDEWEKTKQENSIITETDRQNAEIEANIENATTPRWQKGLKLAKNAANFGAGVGTFVGSVMAYPYISRLGPKGLAAVGGLQGTALGMMGNALQDQYGFNAGLTTGNAVQDAVLGAAGETVIGPMLGKGLNLVGNKVIGTKFGNYLYNQAENLIGKGIQHVAPQVKSAIIASKLNRQIRNTKLPQSQLNVTELHPHSRVKVGDVEINDPNLAYRQVGESIVKEFPITGRQIPTMAESGYGIERAAKPTGIILGKVPFKNPMYAQGHLWYGIPQQKSTLSGLLVTNQPLQYANMTANTVNTPNIITSKDGLVTRVFDPNSNLFSVGTRRIPSPGQLNSTNTSSYIYEPGYGYRKVVTQQPKTSLAFFERQPAKISKGERLGIPKGQERTVINNEEEILNNAKSFAEKYGYEIPETIDAAKAMYKQHNSWFRTVMVDPLYDNSEYGLAFTDTKLQTLPKTESAKILASRGYPAAYRFQGDYEPGIYLDDFVFASPSMATNAGYQGGPGTYTVMLQRPFSFRNPLDWHNAADYRPISKYIYEPLQVGQTQIGNVGPKYELKLATKHLIPVKIAQPADKGTLLGEYLGNIQYKSGGSIHIKKNNKGKFSKVRDYVDYKNNKQ